MYICKSDFGEILYRSINIQCTRASLALFVSRISYFAAVSSVGARDQYSRASGVRYDRQIQLTNRQWNRACRRPHPAFMLSHLPYANIQKKKNRNTISVQLQRDLNKAIQVPLGPDYNGGVRKSYVFGNYDARDSSTTTHILLKRMPGYI